MPEQTPVIDKAPLAAKLIVILLAGSLSMFFAEVLSGSSVLWFITPWAWLITFWLYLAHFLLFINLALIFRRTSLTALYLWGVLFGLYEAWITKVTWAGYMGSEPGWGKILGFAFPELPLIVFFWHPVFAFILPALCFEIMTGQNRILAGHQAILSKKRRNWALAIAVVIIGAAFLSMNAKGNVLAVELSILGSAAIAGILYWIASRRYGLHFSIESLRLGKLGMTILVVYLALLYLVTFAFLLPERIAPPFTILLTLGIYAAIVILLYLKKPDEQKTTEISPESMYFGRKDLLILLVILMIAGIAFSVLTPVDYVLMIILYLALVIAGPVLFILALLSIWKGRRKKSVNTG